MMQLAIFTQTPVRIPRKPIQKLFKKIMEEESDRDARGKINLIFTSDKNIQILNENYRRKNKPTDVLSFNLVQPLGKNGVFGEIYVSVATSRRQAKEYGSTLNNEFLRLVCHGLLHLLGYDHINESDHRKMEAREKHFLKPFIV